MPVIETVAAVATIVGAFQAAGSLYTSYKARKEATQRARDGNLPEDDVMRESLMLGHRTVQEEYDRAWARFGDSFARGDGIGRSELQREIILLRRSVTALLEHASSTGRLKTSKLISASERRRISTVRALVSQYQRMAGAARIQQPLQLAFDQRTNYFAFASNLHLEQMAERCPTSLFVGKATLQGYRWQINERGFANIVQSPADHVEGLVFSVLPQDHLRLDRYEGVQRGYYERRLLPLQLAKCTAGPWKTSYLSRQLAQGHTPESDKEMVAIEASVYLSLVYIDDGGIRAEYAERMKLGIEDAISLGMSRQYVARYVEPRMTVPKPKTSRLISRLFDV